jgi:DNA-binding MarR family transcriptional regulator
MNAPGAQDPEGDTAATAREVWSLMSDLVLDHQRRREVADTLGISFGRSRAVRRLARKPLSMREFADAMGIDPPNATAVVNDLEALGLVRRRPHPTDRRAKLVETTRKGKDMARRADAILGTPPPTFGALSAGDLKTLERLLQRLGEHGPPPPISDRAREGSRARRAG